MVSRTSWRRGVPSTLELVQPAYLSAPPSSSTVGDLAARVAESAGLTLDPEQLLILDVLMAERADGRRAALEAAVIMPRQNGKTLALQALALAELFLFGAELVVWSAHLFPTALEAFRDVTEIVERVPEFKRRLARNGVIRTRGEEGLELASGARLQFRARTKSGGRGLTGDRIILDEAFALDDAEMASLFPTMTTRPNAQIVYASSAGLMESGILRSIRDRGRAGGDPSLAYLEWCAPREGCPENCRHMQGAPGCVLDREDLWQQANPALGRRTTLEYIRSERRALLPERFARERLGWWDEPLATAQGIDGALWRGMADPESAGDDPVFGAWVMPDRSRAAIAWAGTRSDGKVHVELHEHKRMGPWFDREIQRLAADHVVVVHGRNGAMAGETGWEDAGVEPLVVTGADEARTVDHLLDLVSEGRLRHLGDPHLDAAVAAGRMRPLGGSRVWDYRSDLDISPLVAVTLACWGLENGSQFGQPFVSFV